MVPNIALYDGTSIPQVGFGTLNVPADRSESAESTQITAGVVRDALQLGYRHVDTAQDYANEAGVGQGVRDAAREDGVPRDQVYLTSKLANGNHLADDVLRSFDGTMAKLGVEQLDLFLVHWPVPTLFGGDFVSTWRAMTGLLADGRVRSVGVSNFQPEHLRRLADESDVVPVVNQIEVHPYSRNDATRAATVEGGSVIEAWSPLGQGAVLDDPVIGDIATQLDRTPAQVVLRWHVQHGHVVFPKSSSRERMTQNLALFDFELSEEQMSAVDALDRGEDGRIGPHPNTFDMIR